MNQPDSNPNPGAQTPPPGAAEVSADRPATRTIPILKPPPPVHLARVAGSHSSSSVPMPPNQPPDSDTVREGVPDDWMAQYSKGPSPRRASQSSSVSVAVPAAPPQPVDVSGAAPLTAVPAPGEPEVLTPEQLAEKTAERNKLIMLAGLGTLVLATIAYIATTFVAGVTKEVAKKPPEHGGVLGAMLFNQTRMRMMLLAEAVSRNHDSTGEVTLDMRKLTRHGGTASMMTDYWGNNFFLRESRITSAGLDGKQDTKDDFWLDPVLMEMGGWEPDAEQIAESMRGLPGGQAAYEQMKLIQSQRERANRMMEQVEQAQMEAELGSPLILPEGGSESPVVRRSSPRGGEDPMKFVNERESDDPAPTPGP